MRGSEPPAATVSVANAVSGSPDPEVPDVVGFEVGRARRILARAGVAVAAVVVTGDHSGFDQPGRWRVVRQRVSAGGVELVVARQLGKLPADFLLL